VEDKVVVVDARAAAVAEWVAADKVEAGAVDVPAAVVDKAGEEAAVAQVAVVARVAAAEWEAVVRQEAVVVAVLAEVGAAEAANPFL
jgi:hypothetical protein